MDAIEHAVSDFLQRELMNTGTKDPLEVDAPLLERGVIDSLGIQELVAFLEKEFGIDVQDEEIVPENFENVRCIAALVRRLKQS